MDNQEPKHDHLAEVERDSVNAAQGKGYDLSKPWNDPKENE